MPINQPRDGQEQLLDETLEETFPASDPPANTTETGIRVAITPAPRVTDTCSMLFEDCANATPAAANAANPARRAIHALQAARPPEPGP